MGKYIVSFRQTRECQVRVVANGPGQAEYRARDLAFEEDDTRVDVDYEPTVECLGFSFADDDPGDFYYDEELDNELDDA